VDRAALSFYQRVRDESADRIETLEASLVDTGAAGGA